MTDPRTKAAELLEAVRRGESRFTRAGDEWMIVGPADTVTPGAHVDVHKADGSMVTVRVGTLGPVRTLDGVSYVCATFTKAINSRTAAAHNNARRPARTPQPSAGPRRYRTVHSDLYGEGRVYADQPGATQYDDGSGRFNIQIWDES